MELQEQSSFLSSDGVLLNQAKSILFIKTSHLSLSEVFLYSALYSLLKKTNPVLCPRVFSLGGLLFSHQMFHILPWLGAGETTGVIVEPAFCTS